jgi:hypothetical protein
MDRVPPWISQAKGVASGALTTQPPAVLRPSAPVSSQILGIAGDGQIVGWFQRCGSCVMCVASTAESWWSVQTLSGFREAVAALRGAGAVSLEYLPADPTWARTTIVQNQPLIEGGES